MIKQMERQKINLRFGVISGMILPAALSRLIPHPAHFAPVGGMALFGMSTLKRVRLPGLTVSALGASVIFFLVSNFGVWLSTEDVYPHTAVGRGACYVAGIPFFTNTLAGETAVLFGAFEFSVRRFLQWPSKRVAAQ
jgi:hypothetical protein